MTKDKSLAKKQSHEKELVRLGIPPNVRSANEKRQKDPSKESLRLGIPPDIRLGTPQDLKNEEQKKAQADQPRQIKKSPKTKVDFGQTSK